MHVSLGSRPMAGGTFSKLNRRLRRQRDRGFASESSTHNTRTWFLTSRSPLLGRDGVHVVVPDNGQLSQRLASLVGRAIPYSGFPISCLCDGTIWKSHELLTKACHLQSPNAPDRIGPGLTPESLAMFQIATAGASSQRRCCRFFSLFLLVCVSMLMGPRLYGVSWRPLRYFSGWQSCYWNGTSRSEHSC